MRTSATANKRAGCRRERETEMVEGVLPKVPCRTCQENEDVLCSYHLSGGGCQNLVSISAVDAALARGREARRLLKNHHSTTTWIALIFLLLRSSSCAPGIHAHLDHEIKGLYKHLTRSVGFKDKVPNFNRSPSAATTYIHLGAAPTLEETDRVDWGMHKWKLQGTTPSR